MAKISALKLVDRAAQGAVLTFPEIVAKGEPVPWIRFMGADAREAQRFGYETRASFINALRAARLAGEKVSENVTTPEELAEQDEKKIELLALLAMEWGNFEDDDDQPWPLTPENARELFAQNTVIRDKSLTFVDDRNLFFGPSSPTSVPSASTASA